MKSLALPSFLFCLTVFSLGIFTVTVGAEDPVLSTCTYSTYKWNVNLRKSVDWQRVSHPYRELKAFEKDEATGCTVCEEDQMRVEIPGIKPFKMCKFLAADVRKILLRAQQNGFPIYTLVGYRVGMTRGNTDQDGNRTRFSNHSFGIALDVNENLNGLYENCFQFGEQCRLRRGGKWQTGVAGTITAESFLVKEMAAHGMKWGGEIAGRQKDFMHFSPTGY